jgi:integrase/recombinase XerD
MIIMVKILVLCLRDQKTRDRCYHAMARDSAHELLKLRIKDEVFKISPDKKQYAEVLLNGKSGFRHVPMIVSMYRV